MSDTESNIKQRFDFFGFLQFLSSHNIVATAVAALISQRVNNFSDIFVDGLIVPIINRDVDEDGVRDIYEIEKRVFIISGVKFRVGKVYVAVIKFLLVTYCIFIISRLLRYDVNKKIGWF